ncbi:hypothetical protein HYDPIDRAFT_107058 [Hydnomerulius pinastri MD-312]|nr:hypothetical protein HYDPIDRAFT_107058 [Hydnomerulius pinastri MD-312]
MRRNSGSYFANDDLEDGGPTPWEDLDDPSSHPSGHGGGPDSVYGSAQQNRHRPYHSVGGLSGPSSSATIDSYDPASPFNSLPPFQLAHSGLSDKTVSHSRSISSPSASYPTNHRLSLTGYTNPFSSTPPPPEDDLEHSSSYDGFDVSPPRINAKSELAKPLSPLEGVARAIALYDFKAVEAGDLSFSKGDIIIITRKSDSTDDW